jgi:glycogen synthase
MPLVGLADVTDALPGAIATLGILTRTLIPGYPKVLKTLVGLKHEADFIFHGEQAADPICDT